MGPAGPLAVLAMLVLSGCASTPQEAGPADGGSTIRSDIVDDVDRKQDDGKPVQGATTGRVSGIVLHPSGFPLSGAMVTILTVDHSIVTAADGTFAFAEVAPGSQVLRVEKTSYQTLQRNVDVVAGKLTRVEVVLVPQEGSDPGFAEHVHQHWRGQDTYQVFEGTVAFSDDIEQVPPAMCTGGRVSNSCTTLHILPPEGRIIPPGTAKVTVDISFEPGALFDQETMNLHIIPPTMGSNSIDDRGGKLAAGSYEITSAQQTFELELPGPEAADHGHAHWTDWQFYITWYPATGISGDWYNALLRSPVDVTITAHKGELTLDPPHQRYWKDSDTLELGVSDPSYAYCSIVPDSCLQRSPNPTVWTFEDTTTCQSACMTMTAGHVVPPGTTRVQFAVEHYWGDEATVAAAAAAYERNPFIIGYKTAAAPTHHATWENYTWIEPVETTTTGGVVQWTYEVEVEPHETDPYYQRTSRWVVMPAVPGHEDADTWEGIECPIQACGNAYFRLLSFTAINDNRDEMMLAGAV